MAASKIDPARLKSFFARATVVSNLMHSRLAMPLVYPLNPHVHASKASLERNPIADSQFSQSQITHILGQITPVVVGMSKVSNLLKAGHALSYYGGSKKRTTFRKAPWPRVKYKVHLIAQQNPRRWRWATRTGMGQGWDRWGSGAPADSVTHRFRKTPMIRVSASKKN